MIGLQYQVIEFHNPFYKQGGIRCGWITVTQIIFLKNMLSTSLSV